MLTDYMINMFVTAAAAVFFVICARLCYAAGADLWAAIVLGLAMSAALVQTVGLAARRRS